MLFVGFLKEAFVWTRNSNQSTTEEEEEVCVEAEEEAQTAGSQDGEEEDPDRTNHGRTEQTCKWSEPDDAVARQRCDVITPYDITYDAHIQSELRHKLYI